MAESERREDRLESEDRLEPEERLESEERLARRELEHLERRWSADPKVYYVLVLAVLALILVLAWF
jgi:hypothetical protein